MRLVYSPVLPLGGRPWGVLLQRVTYEVEPFGKLVGIKHGRNRAEGLFLTGKELAEFLTLYDTDPAFRRWVLTHLVTQIGSK